MTTPAINCGFARCAIRELTTRNTDKVKRAFEFHELFKDCPNYGIEESYFDKIGTNDSLFNRHCSKIIDSWQKKWHPKESRLDYERTFAISKWKELPDDEKQLHTLSCCHQCHKLHLDTQSKFPQKPIFQPTPIISLNDEELKRIGAKDGTKGVLKTLNQSFREAFNQPFTDTLLTHGESQLQRKPTQAEMKKRRRQIYKKCRDKENDRLKETASMAVLMEDESLRSYQRKRLAQNFETPPTKKARTTKSHSPNFENVSWDKESVLRDLRNHPPAPPPINWQKFAEEHQIPGQNRGQVVKQFAKHSGIDTEKLDGRKPNQRLRRRKRRLLGGEISAPQNPPPKVLQQQWKALVDDGELSLGIPCAPLTLTHFITKNGHLEKNEVVVMGRKFPLSELRKTLLTAQEKYMRLNTDDEIDSMPMEEIISQASKFDHKFDQSTNISEMRKNIKQFQRTRHLILWHDHATLLNLGCVMMTIHVAYDPAVFLTCAEYEDRTAADGGAKQLQSIIERPVIYMLAAGSSSIEDQAALVNDRVDCLHTLSEPIETSTGIKINDKLRFFVGDHPAQQFERGTQQGGKYKCGGCGVMDVMMDDLAYTLQQPRRDLQGIQQLATGGKFGRVSGKLKPFDKLLVAQLREELHARGNFHTDRRKDELSSSLEDTLRGVQRVPTILLLNPTQPLSRLNLQDYCVLDSEPLHDLKGHFGNLLKKLSSLLEGNIRDTYDQIIKSTTTDKMTGADFRITAIQIYLFFLEKTVSPNILKVMETAVCMSKMLYLSDKDRHPRHILQLYNVAWLHHELCRELFVHFHGEITRKRFFGTYLHALVAHAPPQLEIVSLRTVNTENQERIFGQARKTATATSNRQPQNVINSTILRLQAKSEFRDVTAVVAHAESKVAKASHHVPPYAGTHIEEAFISSRMKSWQQHLQRISPYLVMGKGVWWAKTAHGYHFYDGECDDNSHTEGPELMHFRSARLEDVAVRQKESWEKICLMGTELPTMQIQLYNDRGCPSNTLTFPTNQEDNTEGVIETTTPESNNINGSLPGDLHLLMRESTHKHTDLEILQESTHEHTDLEILQVPSTSELSTNEMSSELVNASTNTDIRLTLENTQEPSPQYKTKHASQIAIVIGNKPELAVFDSIRHQLKTQRPTTECKNKHDTLLANLQTLVQRERTTTMEQIKKIERDHYNKYSTLPNEHNCSELKELMTKYKHASKLLALWNIII